MYFAEAPYRKDELPLAPIFGAITLLAAMLAWLAISIPPEILPLPLFCPFQRLTGFPCPTCGGTRALAALFRGDLPSALRLNPLVSLAALAALAAGLVGLARRIGGSPVRRLRINRHERLALRIAAVVAVLANWTYLLVSS